MIKPSTFLVFGATGGTGRHFIHLALQDGHHVKALVRTPSKLSTSSHPNLEIHQGSITSIPNLTNLVQGTDYVVCMLGDKAAQQTSKINTAFIKELIPAMRQLGVKRFLYQAGGLSKPYNGQLTMSLWLIRNTIARGFEGQHQDNEAVMEYLSTEAGDIEWIVHRAGIYGDGASKGKLMRSSANFSVGCHRDAADYNYRVVVDSAAVHTSDFSCYTKD